MKKILRFYSKIRWIVMTLVFLAFIFISISIVNSQETIVMKVLTSLVALVVLSITLFYEYLKHKYEKLQLLLIKSENIAEIEAAKNELVSLDKLNGLKDSITLFNVLYSLDKNKPLETLSLINENEKLFKSNLDALLIKRYSTFKAYQLLDNKTKAKKAYQELIKLKETNFKQTNKMNLLYNWDQIEALHLSYIKQDYQKALKLYNSIDTSKMNPREILHLNVEKRFIAIKTRNIDLLNKTNKIIKDISTDSPFREEHYEKQPKRNNR